MIVLIKRAEDTWKNLIYKVNSANLKWIVRLWQVFSQDSCHELFPSLYEQAILSIEKGSLLPFPWIWVATQVEVTLSGCCCPPWNVSCSVRILTNLRPLCHKEAQASHMKEFVEKQQSMRHLSEAFLELPPQPSCQMNATNWVIPVVDILWGRRSTQLS